MPQQIDLTTANITINPTGKVSFGGSSNGKKIGADFSVSNGGSGLSFTKAEQKVFFNNVTQIGAINSTLKDIKIALGQTNTLARAQGKLQKEEIKKEERRYKAQLRKEKESRIESKKVNILKGVGDATKSITSKGTKGILGWITKALDFFGTLAAAFLAKPLISKLVSGQGIRKVFDGFFSAITAISTAIGKLPPGVITGMGNIIGKTFQAIGSVVSWGIDFFGSALGKIFNDEGKINTNLKGLTGVLQLIAGVGAIKLGSDLIRNPRSAIAGIGNTLGVIGNIFGIKGLSRLGRSMGGLVGGRMGRDLGTAQNPMHVYVTNQGGGGLGDMLGGGTRGLGISSRFRTPRGSGINFSRMFRTGGANGGRVARMGSLINQSTGQATRMLGADRAVDVMSNLKGNNVSRVNRARVLAGELSQQQAIRIAQEGGPQGLKGLLAKGGNFGRGLLGTAGDMLGGLGRGISGLGKFLWNAPGNLLKGGKAAWTAIGEGLSHLNPMQLFENIKSKALTQVDDMLTSNTMVKQLKNLKNMKPGDVGKFIKGLVTKAGAQAKPVVGAIKEGRKTFKVPGLDALIGALTAVAEIALFKASPGNAILGALGGVLGSALGTTVGSAALPGPGSFIGAMAGGIGGELLGRGIARTLGNMLPANIRDADIFGTGAPLFATEGNGYGEAEAQAGMQRGGQIFGGTPTGDSVPAYLERGEYVLNRNAVAAIGPRNLNALNFGIPRFNQGGGIGMTAKSGFIGSDRKDYRFLGPQSEEYFLQIDKDGKKIEIWNEEWFSDKYVGVMDPKSKKIDFNKNWWGGARDNEVSHFSQPKVKQNILEHAFKIIEAEASIGNVDAATANKAFNAMPGGYKHLITMGDSKSDSFAGIMGAKGMTEKEKIAALTNMIAGTVEGTTIGSGPGAPVTSVVAPGPADSGDVGGLSNVSAANYTNNISNQVAEISIGLYGTT